MSRDKDCPFCTLPASRIWLENDHAVAFRDGFPVSPGHTLVVPRQHVGSIFDLPEEVQKAVWQLVAEVRSRLLGECKPDGFNVGINDGQAAGQTVPHAHIHVIPRYRGDVPDPRGGVRWIIPEKAAYWK
jgi:diadenosine tetraphosphate (Ap4A) HIT family hydrolase